MRGATELKEHPFFSGVNWEGLRKIRAPFEPKLSSAVDTQYFPIDEIPQVDTSSQVRLMTPTSAYRSSVTRSNALMPSVTRESIGSLHERSMNTLAFRISVRAFGSITFRT
jgi:hypothetical protein